MPEQQRVLIVDDHGVVRRGLRTLLEEEPWVSDVCEAENVGQAVREAVTGAIDLVVMDVRLPDGNGIDGVRDILRARPTTKILMVTMFDDAELVSDALDAGVRGYMLKDADPDLLVQALTMVADGGFVLGPTIGPGQVNSPRGQTPKPPLDKLTPRELEIVRLLARGESNAKIARELGLSEKTVRNQLSAVFTKLEVSDRVKAALLARDAGLR